MVRALAAAPASAVMPFDFLRLPFVAVIGFAMFGELSDVWVWVGAAVIFGAAYLIARDETKSG